MDNPRETGNLGYARHMTKTNKQCKKPHKNRNTEN